VNDGLKFVKGFAHAQRVASIAGFDAEACGKPARMPTSPLAAYQASSYGRATALDPGYLKKREVEAKTALWTAVPTPAGEGELESLRTFAYNLFTRAKGRAHTQLDETRARELGLDVGSEGPGCPIPTQSACFERERRKGGTQAEIAQRLARTAATTSSRRQYGDSGRTQS
jgi:hypothetical protein